MPKPWNHDPAGGQQDDQDELSGGSVFPHAIWRRMMKRRQERANRSNKVEADKPQRPVFQPG